MKKKGPESRLNAGPLAVEILAQSENHTTYRIIISENVIRDRVSKCLVSFARFNLAPGPSLWDNRNGTRGSNTQTLDEAE